MVTRIPVKYVAGSVCSSRHNKQTEPLHEPRQARYHHHHHHLQQQQQQAGTSARGSPASSINGRLNSLPPSRPRHTAEPLLHHDDRNYTGQRSHTDARPPTVARRATRGRSVSDAGRTMSASAGDALGRSLVIRERSGRRAYWSADESCDDEDDSSAVSLQTQSTSTRSPGSDWSTPGTYRVEFDVEAGYAASDINIHISSDGRLVVHGVRRQIDGARTSTTEFSRKIRLPDDVDPARVDCSLQPGGRLVVEAPRPPRPAPAAVEERLNVPVVTGDDGRHLGLMVELGRLFRADDVVVKVKNSALMLTVVAERTEPVVQSGGRLKAGVTWEFDLPGTVEIDTLRAALTTEGLLRVTARLASPPPLSPSVANSTV